MTEKVQSKSALPRSIYANRLAEFPEIVFAEDAAFQFSSNWRNHFHQRIGDAYDGRLICEIGCADAAYLARIAAKYPHTGFVGLDWKCKPIYDGAARITSAGIRNVILLRSRAQDIGRVFGKRELDELWVFHPDPPMPQTFQGRLIDEQFLLDVQKILREGDSLLAIKTDHADYYQSIMTLIASPDELRRKFSVSIHSADFWADRTAQTHTASRCFSGEKTAFENRFIARRLPIHYIELQASSL